MGVFQLIKIFKIDSMSCNQCAQIIKNNILKLQGVKKVDVNLSLQQAKVEYDKNKVSAYKIMNAIEDSGFNIID